METYVSDFPRFLRVRPNENYDLLLDESILIDPSSMSVAVPRGRGTARKLGERTVLCSPESTPGPDRLFYQCATKLPFRGRQVILVWRDRPRLATEVKTAAEAASTFLAARLIEDRRSQLERRQNEGLQSVRRTRSRPSAAGNLVSIAPCVSG